jgi:hypothetical protein
MAIFFSLALITVAERLGVRPRMATWALSLAWLPLLAGIADALEDTAMLVMAGGTTAQPVPALGLGAVVLKSVCGWTAGFFLLAAPFRKSPDD